MVLPAKADIKGQPPRHPEVVLKEEVPESPVLVVHGGAVDQRRQEGGGDDALVLPSFPVERSTALAERDCLKPREPVAAAGAAEAEQQLVADELAAAAGEDRRAADQTRSQLLAALGGESSDTAAVWSHGGPDHCATLASRLGEPQTGADFGDEGGWGKEKCRRSRSEKRQFRLWDSPET